MSRKHVRHRVSYSAFTLVELLVVIAIIGILVALLLPAVQSAREAVRRNQCMNNIRQFALGAINCLDSQGHFPSGGWGWHWVGDPDRGFGKDQPGGWIYSTLPYIEESAFHSSGSDGDPNTITTQQRAGAAIVVQSPLPTVNCPSRRDTTTFQYGYDLVNSDTVPIAGRSDYAINSGHLYVEFSGGPSSLEQASDPRWRWESDSAARVAGLTGVSHERSEVGMQQIVDGTSKTYLIGEKFILPAYYFTGTDAGDNETWCTGFNNDNYRAGLYPPARDSDTGVVSGTTRFGTPIPAAGTCRCAMAASTA